MTRERGHAVTNLEELLGAMSEAQPSGGRVTMAALLETIGRRSFGPLILFAGLVALSPLGDIPGSSTLIGIFVFLISAQLLAGRRAFWLPGWLLRRSVSEKRVRKALRWLQRPARAVDRLVKPRITALTHGSGARAIAAFCLVVGAAMPLLEVVPFAASGAGAALTAFGLALIAHDGLVAIIALASTAATLAAVVAYFIGR